MPPIRSYRPGALLLLAALSGATGLAACHSEEGLAIELPPAGTQASSATLGRANVERTTLRGEVIAMGTVEAARAVDVGSPMMARVEAVGVTEGDRVATGALLARLDTSIPELQTAQARANLAGVRVQLERATADIERYLPLAEQGIVPQQQVDQLVAQRDALQESVEASRAMVSLAQSQVSDGTIRAPFDGLVVDVLTEVGAVVSPGVPVVRLLDLTSVDVRVRIAETDMRSVQVGQTVPVRLPGLGLERQGTVRFVHPELDASDRTGTALVRIANEDGALLAGAFAEVRFARADAGEILVVPSDAVLRTAAGSFVLVPEGETYRRVPVMATALPDGRWQIDGDVQAGDEIATGALASAGTAGTAARPEGSGAESAQ